MFGFDPTILPGLIYAIFLLVIGVLTICIPFFIFRIRNEIIKTNKILAQIVASLDRGEVIIDARGTEEQIRVCPSCNTPNPSDATICSSCKRVI